MISARLRPAALPGFQPSWLFPAIVAALLAGGCTFQDSSTAAPSAPLSSIAECAALFQEVDTAIARAGHRDAGPVAVKGFPWLRANRFLASFAEDALQQESFEAWVERLGRLDSRARELELRNHGAIVAGMGPERLQVQLDRCRVPLQENLLREPELRAQLKMAVQVPDDYVTAWRIAGLYPLTAPFVSLGVNRWHEETRETFDTAPEELPVAGQLQRWRPPYPEASSR